MYVFDAHLANFPPYFGAFRFTLSYLYLFFTYSVIASLFGFSDVEMADQNQVMGHLKPAGGVGKKLKKKLKLGKGKKHGKGKIRRKHI